MIAAAVLLLAGCQGAGSPAAARRREPRPPFQGAAPKDARKRDVAGEYGGGLVLALAGNPRTFNPILANETSSTDVLLPALVETLVDYDRASGELVPDLARSWTHSDDYKVWEFTLREGLAWSDGHPLTAADVLFSYQVALDPGIQTVVKSVFEGDARPLRVEKVDERTVRFTLTAPKYHYLLNVGGLYILPRHVLEPVWQAGKFTTDAYNTGTPPERMVFCGPYRVKEYVSDQRVVLERNPFYFGVDRDGKRLPYIDTVTFLLTPNGDSAMLKFRNGETDAQELLPKDYQQSKAGEPAGAYRVERVGMSYNPSFWLLNQNPRAPIDQQKLKWFRDKRLRTALAHTVDRAGIVRTVLFGMGEPLYGYPTQGNQRWHNPNVVRREYDLDKARALLDQIGFVDRDGDGLREDPDGRPFSFTILAAASNADRVRTLAILVEDLHKAGIDARGEPVDGNALSGRLRTSHDYEAALLGLASPVPPVPMLSVNVLRSSGITHYWNPQQPQPESEWEARIDRLVSQIESTPDYETQKKLHDQVQEILAEEVPWFTTVVPESLLAVKSRVKNAKPSPLRPMFYWNLPELWLDPVQ